jgi:hypothetical protein
MKLYVLDEDNTAEGVGVYKKDGKNQKLHKHTDQTIIIWEPFFNPSKIKSVSSVHAAVVFTFFACLFSDKNKYIVSAFFFENPYKF